MPVLAIVFICSLSLQAQDCNRDTAVTVFTRPVPSQMACMMTAQEVAAHSGYLEGDDRLLKVKCENRPQT